MPNSILVGIFSLAIAFLSTPIVIRLAKRYKLVDDRRSRSHPAHTHKGVIPRAGGVPMLLGLFMVTLIFIPMTKIIVGILIGALLIVIMGLLDDKYDLSPYKRFFLNVLIAAVVILFGLGIPYISSPFGGVIRLDTLVYKMNFFGVHKFYLWSNLFSLIWIVTIMNFVNWSKGVDGQMPGFVAIASIYLGILAFRFSAYDISTQSVSALAGIVAGSFLGFLPWNFYPQKIMPGYSGGALAGFLLAVLSILTFGKVGTLILVLSIPLIDAIYVILRRLKNKKSPFVGDALHFHHRLLELGWGKRRVAFFYWLVTFFFGSAALFFKGSDKLILLILVFTLLAAFIYITDKIKKINGNI